MALICTVSANLSYYGSFKLSICFQDNYFPTKINCIISSEKGKSSFANFVETELILKTVSAPVFTLCINLVIQLPLRNVF
jgi:hypothetical protein